MEQNNSTPAFPFPDAKQGTSFYFEGLTKREYFAAMAMQGFLATYQNPQADPDPKIVAAKSIQYADELLNQLSTPTS